MQLEVWAPYAKRVEAIVAERRIPLAPGPRGWWSGHIDAAPGTEYSFSLDGGEPRPDPRSPSQPHGVHGPSRVVDHDGCVWNDAGWTTPPLRDAVIYELHVGTFTPEGTFEAVATKLDHLVALGVTAIELMPVNQFSGNHGWGYDGVDLYAPHNAYGGPEGLKKLVDACHSRGLAVILDVVYNHLGPEGNYLREFGPYFTDRYSTPWGQAVNFDDRGSDEVRSFFIDNALMWLRDYHFDGIRVDAVHAILDTSAVHFLEELAAAVHGLDPAKYAIAESDLNDPRLVRRPDRGGYGMDAQWSDDFHHALHAVLTGERNGYYSDFGRMEDIATALERAFVYGGEHSTFRGRRHGRPASGLTGDSFLGYIQTHDQVGNRALGERIGHLVDIDLVKVAAGLVLTSPFVPMLFQGEEWGASAPFCYFTDHSDAELGRAVSKGRRAEFAAFGWDPSDIPDPQDPGTFARSKLDWDEIGSGPHAELLAWYRDLIALRRELPELRDGDLDRVRTWFDEAKGLLVFERGPVTVACNLSHGTGSVPAAPERSRELLACSAEKPTTRDDEIEMPGHSLAIFMGS